MNIGISLYQSRVQALQLKIFWSFPCFCVPFSVSSHFRKNRIMGHKIVIPRSYLSFAFHLDLRLGLASPRTRAKISGPLSFPLFHWFWILPILSLSMSEDGRISESFTFFVEFCLLRDQKLRILLYTFHKNLFYPPPSDCCEVQYSNFYKNPSFFMVLMAKETCNVKLSANENKTKIF